MSELILHQYDFSNFSEKIRLVFGLKGLSWSAVEIPSHLPKPDYTPLTGGYRRTPALQIGADIFCDTHLIVEEIESRYPAPSIYGETNPAHVKALSECLASWAEGPLLWPAALYITGINAEQFPAAFHTDRARLHHKPVPTLDQVKAAGLKYKLEMTAQMSRIEDLLLTGNNYLLGDHPTLADVTVYGSPWLLETIGGQSPVFENLPKTRAWLDRIKGIGAGERKPLGASDALALANDASPSPLTPPSAFPQSLELNDLVSVAPRDEHSPAEGKLVYLDEHRITIRIDNERVNHVHVHFPRTGYRVSKVKR